MEKGGGERWATFDEGEHLGVRDVSGLKVDLQSQQQSEQQFVFLVQTPGCVTVHLREDKHVLGYTCSIIIQSKSKSVL